VTGGKGNPRGFARDFGHAWLRLLTPDGHVYSVGFFPDESMNLSPDRRPGLRMPGMLLHPDKYDGLRYPSRATRIPLSPSQFDDIVTYLEDLQAGRSEGTLGFGLVDRSCVWFLTEVAAIADVRIDATYNLVRAAIVLLPHRLLRRLPRRLRHGGLSEGRVGAAAARAYSVLFNLGLYALGGRRVVTAEWVRTAEGSVAERRVSGLAPVFDRPHRIFGPTVPFFHVQALISWQRSFDQEDPN